MPFAQERMITASESQCPFVPAPLVKSLGLKTGHLVQGSCVPKWKSRAVPRPDREEVMNSAPEEASRVTPFTELVVLSVGENFFRDQAGRRVG